MLRDIGDTWAEQDKNLAKAIEAYEEALELQPDDHPMLHKLLASYQGAGQWEKLIETVERIANLEAKAERKAATHVRARCSFFVSHSKSGRRRPVRLNPRRSPAHSNSGEPPPSQRLRLFE